jgi:hypothetical protein
VILQLIEDLLNDIIDIEKMNFPAADAEGLTNAPE